MNQNFIRKENMSSPKFKIPLFDVDWTLLEGANKVHYGAFDFALHTVFNQPEAFKSEVKGEGRIDTQILMEILKLHGVSEEQAKNKMSQAIKAMAKYFIAHADEGHFVTMPGVKHLLSSLKAKGLTLGLLTGNVEEIAWEKVKRARIGDYFTFGAFGSLAFKRVDLIPIAKKRLEKILDQEIPLERFVIVGDSPLDIACARAGGIPVIAVGAGHYKSHELTDADLIVNSLEEKDKITNFLRFMPT